MTFDEIYRLGAPRDRVFEALTDPDTLRRCIPGCEALVPQGEDRYDVTMTIGIGGSRGTYLGRVELHDKRPPEFCRLVIESRSGSGRLALAASELRTEIACQTTVEVGGLLGMFGGRMLAGPARQLMNEFFRALAAELRAV